MGHSRFISMERMNEADVNTASHYNDIFNSPRVAELNAHPFTGQMISKLTTHGKILDVGCFQGNYFPYMSKCEIFGIDFCPSAIAAAHEKYPQADVRVGDFVKDELPYDNHFFDFLFIGEVIEHVEDPRAIIEECHRVLKAWGTIIVTCPFESLIPCPEHLWSFNREDFDVLFADFRERCLLRYGLNWEHFMLVAKT